MVDLNEITPTTCSCPTCNQMCCYRPCWGTPEDIRAIIDGGFSDRLMVDWWEYDISFFESILILTPAKIGHGGEVCSRNPTGTCTLFLNKRCQLHSKGLKPTEGKLSHCGNKGQGEAIHLAIVRSWDNPEAQAMVREWAEARGLDLSGCRGSGINTA